MPITFNCPYCSVEISVGWESLGKTGKCRGCGRPITVPFPSPDSPSLSSAQEAAQNDLPKEWHVAHAGRRCENLSLAAVIKGMACGAFPSAALACKEGTSVWKPINDIPDFRAAVAEINRASRKSNR